MTQLDLPRASALNEIAHPRHQFVEGQPIRIMQRWRSQSAAANGNGDADMHRRRRLEAIALVEAIESREAAQGEGD